ncbi:MAG TPA: MBG domain-containing protein, partial [Cyclobacteriaceae bacterium]|nr:MBG domain-containing protein [Cyclobacteriaceae bacterium]
MEINPQGMKPKFILTFVTCFIIQQHFVFSQNWQLLKKIGIGNSSDQSEVLSSATDSNGNTFVLGWYMGKITFGNLTYTGSTTSHSTYFLAKYDTQGNVQWSKSITSTRSSIDVYDVVTDNEGNAYILGNMNNTSNVFEGIVHLDNNTSLTLPSIWDPYNGSSFICRYSPTGIVQLKKFFTGSSENPLSVNAHGLIVLKGKLLDAYTAAMGPDDYFYFDSLTCYSHSGQKLWQKKHDFLLYSSDIQFFPEQESLWIISNVESYNLEFNGESIAISNETLITELNPTNGNLLSVTPTDHNLKYLYAADMEIRDSKLYLYGAFFRAMQPSVSFGSFTVTTTKSTDTYYYGHEGYLTKYNVREAKFEWAKLLTSVPDVGPLRIGVNGTIFLNTGKDGVNTPKYLSKFSASGDLIWSLKSEAFIHDYIDITLSKAEDVFVTGWASNGGIASFGNLYFTYNNQVGFLAKVANEATALSSLSINPGILSPTFQPHIQQYSSLIDQSVTAITITPVASDPSSIIQINDILTTSGQVSQPIGLAMGNNIITVTVTATDGSENIYILNIIRGNTPPILSDIGSISATEGMEVTFTASAFDSQSSQLLSYSLIAAPTGASIHPTSGVFSWWPNEVQGGGTYTFSVRVTDNGNPQMFDQKEVSVTVAEVNSTPTLTPIENISITCGGSLNFTIIAKDEDLPTQQLVYSLKEPAPNGATVETNTGNFSWKPSMSQLGNHFITVRVSDSGSPVVYHETSFSIVVKAIDKPKPLGTWTNDLVFNSTETFTVASDDPLISYTWSLPTGFLLEEGQNTNSIIVKAVTGTANGNIVLAARGECGEVEELIHKITALKADANVIISGTEHEFSGESKSVTIATDPPNLSVEVLYNDKKEPPHAAGTYNVVASVVDNNYKGSNQAEMVIRAVITDTQEEDNKFITWPNPTSGM